MERLGPLIAIGSISISLYIILRDGRDASAGFLDAQALDAGAPRSSAFHVRLGIGALRSCCRC